MTNRENWLRTVEFRNPEWIPCGVALGPRAWHQHREKLEEVCLRHPRLFPGFEAGKRDFDSYPDYYRAGERRRDNWGCLWYGAHDGIEGMVIEHPLEDWSALATYAPPDPAKFTERGTADWEECRKAIAAQKERGELTGGNGERLFDRLYFLRGFDNLMIDIATDDPHLPVLIEMLTEHQVKLSKMWLELGVDTIYFHTDIGTQQALMISPEKFRKYIKPMFKTIFQTCRNGGAHVGLSSDGNLTEIVDDLVECGVSTHDPQVGAAGIDGIVKAYKGKLCANVDLDRQMFPFCSPQDITSQVKEVVEKMGAPEGGLMVAATLWDAEIPIENIEAMCAALEKYCLKDS